MFFVYEMFLFALLMLYEFTDCFAISIVWLMFHKKMHCDYILDWDLFSIMRCAYA